MKRLMILSLLMGFISCFNDTSSNFDDNTLKNKGRNVYVNNCQLCHLDKGQGIPAVYPPLNGSDYMIQDVNRTIKTILYGSSDSIIVNGLTYSGGVMPSYHHLSDEEIANVTTYIFNIFGNQNQKITVNMVKNNRE